MKIEMGESLLASWLKHVKGCKIVETNWKKSGNWEMNDKNDLSDYVFEKIKQYPELFDAFKSDLHQTLKQAEIDAIGINIEENTIYMIDVAFHEKGLNYGSKIETRDRVIKKLLRSYLMALQIFPNFKYEILFVSPKVNHSTEELITDSFTIFKTDFINDKVNFDYISNEEFKTKILIPVLEKTKKESDTSELFLRSVKMMTMFDMVNEKTVIHDKEEKVSYNESIYKEYKRKQLNKTNAINLCKKYNNEYKNMNNQNTSLASKNSKKECYWLEPNLNIIKEDWWVLLYDWQEDKLYIFFIPKNSLKDIEIKKRKPKKSKDKRFCFEINYNDKEFECKINNIKFIKWYKNSIQINKK